MATTLSKEYLVCLRYDPASGGVDYRGEHAVMELPGDRYGLKRNRDRETRFLERNGWPEDRQPPPESLL